ncbi:uncharacterized protein LOC126790394 [Argentina anserina]|uniref:uncharacterized protein LOC126790394 n=1 Tax=Argentina anserina TaxID=57926 RepID=UPI0021766709|nr:uncharacterized protein LOC126790394 [Potentilla anserina]
MDHKGRRDKDFEIDLESGLVVSEEDSSDSSVSSVKKQTKTLLAKVYGGFSDGSVNTEDRVGFCGNGFNSNGVCPENLKLATNKTVEGNGGKNHEEKTRQKDKRKKTSNKKPPKPPRPPRGPSLDAADQKLIKELSEIAMWKRARVERMKALKKMKAAKASSSNSNVYAMVFTILFCVVLIFQGISSSRSSTTGFEGSPLSSGRMEGSLISIQFYPNPSSNALSGPRFESLNMVEQVAGSDQQEKLKRWAR